MTEERVIHIHRTEGPQFKDSIEFNASSKIPGFKCYFDSSDPEDAMRRIDNAIKARDYARERLGA